MTKRIRELAEQADLTDYFHWTLQEEGYTDLEKFAQLIIQECAEIAKKEQAFNARYSDADKHPQVNINQCILVEFGL